MSGVKGRSGRGNWEKAIDLKKLWDLSIPVLKYALTSDEIPLLRKAEIALALTNKMTPTQLEHSGEIKGQETRIMVIIPESKKADYESRLATAVN